LAEDYILVDRMREQEMVARDWMGMDKVKCAQEMEGGDLLAVFRSIVKEGGIIMLGGRRSGGKGEDRGGRGGESG
jgi:hypothetical protein